MPVGRSGISFIHGFCMPAPSMNGTPFHAQPEGCCFFFSSKGAREPRSVLDNQKSPSSPTSTSTRSSSGIAGVAAISDNPSPRWPSVSDPSTGAELTAELKPVPAVLGNVEVWDSMFLDPPPLPDSDHSFVRWLMPDFTSGARLDAGEMGLQIADPGFVLDPMFHPPPSNFSPVSGFPNISLKPPLFANSFLAHDNYMPPVNLGGGGAAAMAFEVPNEPPWQQQALVDQLFKAAELVESGNTISAHRILARLNHHLPSPSGKPLNRSAFYFKEALLAVVSSGGGDRRLCPIATPLDIPLKLSAYKAFTEISPVLQFTSFTSAQAILEELASASGIHVVDFDVGIGSHWPAFIQELSQRPSAATGVPLPLRITAFVLTASYHPLELHLIQENLAHFAANLNVLFELNFLPLESFDPAAILSSSMSSGEAIAVNFSVSCGNRHLQTQTLLHMIKQLSPVIVISLNLGCERSDLSFSHHFLHSFQSTTVLLDSIEASGVPPEIADKIERYLLRPRIESSVQARHRARDQKLLPWKALFTSAGFVPVQFSNFAETQADCLLKKAQVRGFQVEKRQASLVLSWQQGEIALVSAWR
ncbi:Scarecrow-like protein 6 [Platanthera guangdongensis]|uniref:Scarecrow-like protein 6 n=1 Tax=Platanthera guangdongensis TaxID=2320717 RepID=A0ABR2LPS6_9ASPA